MRGFWRLLYRANPVVNLERGSRPGFFLARPRVRRVGGTR